MKDNYYFNVRVKKDESVCPTIVIETNSLEIIEKFAKGVMEEIGKKDSYEVGLLGKKGVFVRSLNDLRVACNEMRRICPDFNAPFFKSGCERCDIYKNCMEEEHEK